MKRSPLALGVAGIVLLASVLAYYHFEVAPRIRTGRLAGHYTEPSSRPEVRRISL